MTSDGGPMIRSTAIPTTCRVRTRSRECENE